MRNKEKKSLKDELSIKDIKNATSTEKILLIIILKNFNYVNQY